MDPAEFKNKTIKGLCRGLKRRGTAKKFVIPLKVNFFSANEVDGEAFLLLTNKELE